MKTLAVLSVSAVAAVCVFLQGGVSAQDKDKEAKLDPAKLVGKWQYVSGIKNGDKVTGEALKQKVTITKDKISLENGDKFVFKYEVNASKKPATIKLEMLESPFGAGAKSEGVIEITAEDQVRLCYAPMGEAAPKTFESKEGSKMHLFVLKRAK